MDIVDFLKIALKKKKPVVLIVMLGMFTGLFSYFIFKPVYETNITFMVLESKLIRKNLEGKKLDIDTYTSLINNVSVLKKVYDKLDLHKKYSIPFEVFKEKISVLSVENTAIIKTTVKFENKEECVKIANCLIEQVLKLNKSIILKEIESGYSYSEKQVELARNNFKTIEKKLAEFNNSNNLKKLALEIDILKNQIAFHSLGNNVSYPIVEGIEIAQSGNKLMQPSYILSLANNKDNQSLVELNRDILNIESKLKHTSADNKKVTLKKRLSVLKNLKSQKQKLIKALKAKLDIKTKHYLEVLNKAKQLKSEFLAAEEGFLVVYKNFVASKTEVMGKTKEMTVIDYPVKPEQQVFPRLVLNTVAGLMLGILIAVGYLVVFNLIGQVRDD
jgi:capsular polysaccharide biosynthesis protein